ncbi:uncharacterized protein LOC113537884 [Pangasianodon hypophthalmus]|uniref:uncharacterized protein LOC113537884 n=1 Tax=Pangasianodon hypophthalmus TaxID=310915 RepID=UPI00147D154E|nr:uncharacterized protein LOC113537884 [Pangasianodon hypophthalmus]
MPLRVYWLLLLNLAVNISAETVYSSGSQYGREIGNLAEAERTPATSESLPQEVSCSGVKGQGPCSEMVSTGGSNDPSFQAASYNGTFSFSGVASQGSRHDIIQLGDAYSSPVFASSLNSSPSVRGSNLVQNLQPVVSNNNAEYDPSTPHIASYGSVYRLLKPHGAYSSSRTVPSASYKLPISSSVTTMSKSIPNGQNGYKPGFSQISYDATQQGDANNSVAATYYSRNKPSLSSMVISSGPMIKFIMPNESNYQLVQTINKAQSSNEPDTSIKPLVTVDLPTTETSKPFEHSQGMIYQRPTSQPQVPNESRCQCPQTVKKPIASPKPHLASKNPSTLQSKTTETRFTHLGNAYSSVDTTHKSSSVFKPAQTTYMQQIAQQLAGFSQDDVHDSSSTVEPLSGSVYTRPGYVYGTFVNTGASMYMPSSSAKTVQSNYMQHFYEAGLYFTKVVYGSSSSAVASGDSKDGFTLSGNANSSADNTYTSNSQPTASGSNLSQNPYFIARQGQSSYSMFKPQQPNYKSFPTRYMQIPSKSFNTSFSQKDSVQDSEQLNQMRNQLPDIQAVTSEGFQTWHHSVLVSAPLQDSDQSKHPRKPDSQPLISIQSHPYKPKNLFEYLSSLPLPAGQSVSSNYNQLQTGQSTGQPESANLTNYNPIQTINSTSKPIQGYHSPAPSLVSQGSVGLAMPRPVSDPLNSGYVVDQASNQSVVLVKPSQQFFRPFSSLLSSPESRPVSSESWYRPSQPDSEFALRSSRPVLNFQKVSFTRPLQSGKGSFSPTQKEYDSNHSNYQLSYD